MYYSPGNLLAVVMAAMTAGGFLGFALRSAVLFLAVHFVMSSAIERPRSEIAVAAVATAGAGSAAYHALWLVFGIVGLPSVGVALGLLAVWLAIQVITDKMLGLGLEKSNTLTTTAACASFILWLIFGIALVLLRTEPA